MQAQAPANQSGIAKGRIFFITSCPEPWGGSEELWAGAACHLHKRGFNVHSGRSDFWGRDSLHSRFVELHSAGVGVRNFSISWLERAIPDTFRSILPGISGKVYYARDRWLARKIQNFRPDLVVISQGGTYDGMTIVNIPLVCHFARLPYVLVCQKSSEIDWPSDDFRSELRRVFLQAERVYFVSKHNQRITNQQLGISIEHGEVVRNPFMLKTTETLPWPVLGEGGRFRLACVGRMYPREKGQDVLLNVLAREKWRSRPIDIDFFGAGQQARGLEEMARFLGLRNAHFRGFTNDVIGVWRDHHALVLASRSEGLPLAQVEAMICGRPVIVAPAGGAAEIMRDGETGFIAAAATEDAFDDALERAWHQRDEWEALGLNAAKQIAACFPGDPCAVFADKLEAIHQTIIERRSNGKSD